MKKTSIWLSFGLIIIVGLTACSNNASTNPPWKAPVVGYEAKTIAVKVNQEFIVQYKQTGQLFSIIQEEHDDNAVELIDSKAYTYGKDNESSIKWYLYKAIKPGKTDIFVKRYTDLMVVLVEKIEYNVTIK